MKTLHTPGPWQDGAERDGKQTVHYVKAGTCNIYLNRGVGQTEQEARANIKLIASSPDLLGALKMIADVQGAITIDSGWLTMPDGTQVNLGRLVYS